MDVKPSAAFAAAPIVNDSGRLWNLLVRGDNAPPPTKTLWAKLGNLSLGKCGLCQVTVSPEGSKDFHYRNIKARAAGRAIEKKAIQ